jgi:type IV pilus assembly protein PilB
VALRIGELLLEAGIVSPEQIAQALKAQRESPGKRVGALLVEKGIVTETQLTQALSRQLAVPWVSLWHVDFSRKMLALVPHEIADSQCLIPVYVRKVPKQGNTLYVAMADPTNEEGIRQVSSVSGLPVKPMIASPSDIRSAIRAYYGGVEEPVARPPAAPAPAPTIAPHPAPTEEEAPVIEVVDATPLPGPLPPAPPAEAFEEMAAQAPAPTKAKASAKPGAPEPAAAAAQKSPRPRGRRISLTLLDGTTIQIPSEGKATAEGGDDGDTLTTRDLVAALRAIAHGASADDILPDARWEPILAALLALLLKKHLIADWEFVEELKKG